MKIIAIAMGMLSASVVHASVPTGDSSPTESRDYQGLNSNSLVETGVAISGTKLHAALVRWMPGVAIDQSVSYQFVTSSNSEAPRSVIEQLLTVDLSQKNEEINVSAANAPDYTPNGIPSSMSTNDSCAMLTIGASSAVGDVTLRWECRNMRDTKQ